jgi:ATP-binding cassette subfamily B multidrug efflux pump
MLVAKPEIYLFDDSFSALDYATDAALRAALAHETADATVVIVAQRVSTIRDADRIVVLNEGLVVGTGTHAELMDGNETYREIVLSQLTEKEAAAA